ncbi:MAG: alanine/glycine:cation symporter family protein [Fuerstiella sp.]
MTSSCFLSDKLSRFACLLFLVAFCCLPTVASAQEAEVTADNAAVDTDQAMVAPEGNKGIVQKLNDALKPIDDKFGEINGFIGGEIIFRPITVVAADENGTPARSIPAAVLVLIAGATFFTLRMKFINLRGFKHAILVTAGKYDDPNDAGEVTHFQALTAALSATVGLGNIGGVATAIALGGPGATLWMMLAGLIGMTSKFVECSLGQMYREVRPDGRIMGGAMYYLSRGLKEMGLGPLGKVLGVAFAILCVGGSFAGGNSYQVNQSLTVVGTAIPFLAAPLDGGPDYRWVYGLVMAALVGVVIIGGIRRIAGVAEKIVPAMCGIYVLAALAILAMNATAIPAAFSSIITGALNPSAAFGGFVGVLVMGFKRAAFSNEAGVGSAAIAHAAAKTDHPIREGLVALLEPFIDTVVICTITALVIIVTGAYLPESGEEYARFIQQENGAGLTALAMESQITGFKYVLCVCVILFAFSTMISWSYYGERCWAYLFGDKTSMWYRCLFVVFTFLGSVISATNVMDFGDLMIFGMAIPNIIGLVLLSGKVARELIGYMGKLASGELDIENQR